jgi:ubiquinone/menaquinone biosynthesis C-methylase UbiE
MPATTSIPFICTATVSNALDLAERLAKTEPEDVLETAAGTGVLTRAIASRVSVRTRIVATDLNQPMLDHAKARMSPHGRIEWRQADALDLPFADQSFDVVACQFGVMFFPDKLQGYREARRVLKAGGRFFFNVWDRISENEFANVVTEALGALFPHDPPRFMARIPHGYHDVEQIHRSSKKLLAKKIDARVNPAHDDSRRMTSNITITGITSSRRGTDRSGCPICTAADR